MRAYSRQELAYHAKLIGSDFYCKRPADIAFGLLDRLLPKEKISTLEYSTNHRKIRNQDGEKTDWLPDLTPYLIPIMEALDNPAIPEIVVPKPGRVGGTMAAENFILKMFDFGPAKSALWYLKGPKEVGDYATDVVGPMFEDHAVGKLLPRKGSKGNTDTKKKVGSQTFSILQISPSTLTNRQAYFIGFDEVDSYPPRFRSSYMQEGRTRQIMLGADRKLYACSHPDLGWAGGIAAAWTLSTQGIYVMQCANCGQHASPYPTKYWPEVPKFRLYYEKAPEGTPIDQRLSLAEQTASLVCPHCYTALDEKQRHQMSDEGAYMHKGQTLDINAGIMGEPDSNKTWGFWIHVLMSKQANVSSLARELEGAIEHKERTGKTEMLRQVLVRTFGEAFESATGAMGLDAASLKRRATDAVETPTGYQMGEIPDGVKFLTLAVDVGGTKKPFDLMVIGWDLQRRRYLIDRRTIRQRLHPDGIMRDMNPTTTQADWSVLEEEIDRIYPFKSDPDMGLPIAVTTVDIKDGNATPFGVQFLRDMDKRRWKDWRKVRGIMGAKSQEAPEVAVSPKDYNTDTNGKKIEPPITVHNLGVHKLKTDVLETLAIEDGSPGCWNFPTDMPLDSLQQFFNEPYIDGKWVQNGPNESLDLGGHSEAGRQMLEPDRKDRNWTAGSEPIWAKPVSLKPKGGDLAVAGEVEAKKPVAKTPGANLASILGSLDRG